MTDCRLLTIILVIAVVAILFFVFGGCRVECHPCKDVKRENLDTLTDPFAYEYSSDPQANPSMWKYGMGRRKLPLELNKFGAYQNPDWLGGVDMLPGPVGVQNCGPCE